MKRTIEEVGVRGRFWQSILGLSSWDITCELASNADVENGEAYAKVETSEQYETAHITFAKQALKQDDEHLDITIVHELLHVMDRDFQAARNIVADQLSPAVEDLWERRMRFEMEGVIEKQARIIVEFVRLAEDAGKVVYASGEPTRDLE